jgi:hypothetical protein
MTEEIPQKRERLSARELRAAIPLSELTWHTTKECCAHARLSESKLRALVKAGKGPPSTLISARARRFNRPGTDEWIKAGGATL